MKISTLDLRASDEFIRAELKKHPGATVAEIQDSVKKRFNRGTSAKRIANIRRVLTSRDDNQEFQEYAKILAIKMKGTKFLSIAFVRNGKKVKISWQHEKTDIERGSTEI